MLKSVKIERAKDYEMSAYVLSHSETAPVSDRFFFRPVNYELLVATHLPEPDRLRSGALVTLLLNDPNVIDLEIRQTNAGFWVADARVGVGEGWQLRRGESDTPTDALTHLILNIQRF
jgi:hypothetical protein